MPSRPARTCPSCRQVIARGARCSCQAASIDQPNPYRNAGHQAFRTAVIARSPICELCGILPAVIADHWPQSRSELLAAGLDPNDPAAGRALCRHCDSKQTARRQPGGWNRPGWKRSG